MAASSTILRVFGMTRPGVEPWSPGPLSKTLLIRPMAIALSITVIYNLFISIVIYAYLYIYISINLCVYLFVVVIY